MTTFEKARIFNRIVRATENGWEYDADRRHGELIIQAMGLAEAKLRGITSPGEDLKQWDLEEDEKLLDMKAGSEYRQVAARANFLALDRPDIQFSVKEICSAVSSPTVGDRKKIKRLALCLFDVPRLVSNFEFQEEPHELEGFSDSDWAMCKRTARSTSGGAILAGKH